MTNTPKIGKKSTDEEKPRRILIVDDDSDFAEMLNLMLSKDGFETAIAKNGEDLLNKIDDFQPDLITLDVMMPGLTTEEILEKLIKKKCKSKIILLTVVRYSKEVQEEFLKKESIVSYITKPFDLDDFIGIVDELLQTHKFKRYY